MNKIKQYIDENIGLILAINYILLFAMLGLIAAVSAMGV